MEVPHNFANVGSPDLRPYIPRLVVDWLAHAPGERYMRVNGSLVFIDVSGFTALSERLARQGKAGAEQLTVILDDIFSNLMDHAWDLGGRLIKFGGDALLLLFDGPEHPRRACAAAYDLRAELALRGSIVTAAGPVQLRMSVGVHTGDFDFFLVGESHRELLLTGSGASAVVVAEGLAEADQIVLTSATAAALDPHDTDPLDRGHRLLLNRPQASLWEHSEYARPDDALVESAIPLGLRRHLSSTGGEPEHRMVTVGFCHFMGVDQLLRRKGPATVAAALDELVCAAQRHLDDHGVCFLGSDVYKDGGKLILVAGAPEATENDEERMLRALRAMMDERLRLRLRAGVNRGHVYSGDVGPWRRRTYTVMGDAVNLAARLMQAARPGEIYATRSVLERSATQFETEPLPAFHVKGKTRAVEAFTIGAPIGSRRASMGDRLPLIGRDAEMAVIQAALDGARRGHGGVVALVGPGGIGKSRIAEEVRAAAEDMVTLTVLCEQYEADAPYWPMRWLFRRVLDIPLSASPKAAGSMLRQRVESIDSSLLPWLPLLAILVDAVVPTTKAVEELEDAFRHEQLERIALELLRQQLDGPTLLVVEDLHWMDAASHSLLRKIAIETAENSWALVLTSRHVDWFQIPLDQENVQVLHLEPLKQHEAKALALEASELAGLLPHQLEALTQRAEGSPLFLLELIANARATGGDQLPETIEAAITARIDKLDPGDRALLRCAAVLGMSFRAGVANEVLWDTAAGLADGSAWDRLAEFIVWEKEDRLRFRHALVREVAYEGLPFSRRRMLHGIIGERLEQLAEDPDALAGTLCMHFLRAERFEKAWRYASTAGAMAREKGANADAANFYAQALDAARKAQGATAAEICQIAETLGDVSELAGLFDQSAWAYRVAYSYAEASNIRRADLLRKAGHIHERAGRYRHARIMYRRGRQLLPHCRSREEKRALSELEVATAAVLMTEGRFKSSLWWARRAVDRLEPDGDQRVLAHAYYTLDSDYTQLGEPGLAKQYRHLALPIYEKLGDLDRQAKVLNNLGANAYWEGAWEDAISYYERAKDALDRAGNVVESATVATNIGEVLLQQGQIERAEPLFREAVTVHRGAGHPMGKAWALCNLGLLLVRSGRRDEGHVLLLEAREQFSQIGAESMTLEVACRLVESSLLNGETRHARELLERALEAVSNRGGMPIVETALWRLQGYACMQVGEVDRAGLALQTSLQIAESLSALYEIALTLDAMGILAELRQDDGTAVRARAAALLQDLGVISTPRIPLRRFGHGEPLHHGTG